MTTVREIAEAVVKLGVAVEPLATYLAAHGD